MRPHAAVLRGARRPRRFRREIGRLYHSIALPGRWDDRLVTEFATEIEEHRQERVARAERQAAIDSLYGEWNVHVEPSS